MKKVLSILLAIVMVIGFSPLALANDGRIGVTSTTNVNANTDILRVDTTTQARTHTRTNGEVDVDARIDGRARILSQEGREREAHVRQARTQADERFERACAEYNNVRERYEQARSAYARATANANTENEEARIDASLRVRLETAHEEYLRAREACANAREAHERDVRQTMTQVHTQTRDDFQGAREEYAQARERYAQAREEYARVRLEVSEGARIDMSPTRERYEQAREALEQARVRYEAALNAQTTIRIRESLTEQELAQKRYEEARERYENIRSREELRLDADTDVDLRAQARAEYEQARNDRERAMRESINERRAITQERYEEARERYEQARERVANARERIANCNEVGLCQEEREDLRRDAKPFLTAGADVVVEAIEQTIIRIEASNMPEEEKRTRIAALEARIEAVLDARVRAANIDVSADVEHIQQASSELRREWLEAREEVRVSQGLEVNARLKHVHNQLTLLGERLEQAISNLRAQGYDVSVSTELMTQYDMHLQAAHKNYEAAIQAYAQARTANDFNSAVREANEYVRQAHAELRQARELLREIVRSIRAVDATVDLSAEAEVRV